MHLYQADKVQNNVVLNEDPYLSRNLVVNNPRIHQKEVFIMQKKNSPLTFKQPTSPIVQNTHVVNLPQKSPSKLKIVNPPHEIKLKLQTQQ
jgi:hypothetical protein